MVSKIALLDLDGTLADYEFAMIERMKKLQAPCEDPFVNVGPDTREADHLHARRMLIQNTPGFWTNLKPLPLGFEIVDELKRVGFTIHVLTKGPRSAPTAWSEKIEWCKKHLPYKTDVTITSDKSLTYGRVLVDDSWKNIQRWLAVRPRGLAVFPHPQEGGASFGEKVFVYTGKNRKALRAALRQAYER